jgi:hypothetical protein
MSFAFAAVECSSGVKLRNVVKGLLLRGLLRLMALFEYFGVICARHFGQNVPV